MLSAFLQKNLYRFFCMVAGTIVTDTLSCPTGTRTLQRRDPMPRKITPSSTMYRQLKSLGVANHEAARMLLNTSLVFDGKTISSRIDDSSQLTRRVVHVEPGEIPVGMFNNFQISCPQLHRRILERTTSESRVSEEQAARNLFATLRDESAPQMLRALSACGIDGALFRNMLVFIEHADLERPQDRSLLLLMLLVVTGCTANPHTASIIVIDYATNVLGADYHTAQTVFNATTDRERQDIPLGLVRVTEGHILKGTPMHVLNPAGTTIGLMPRARHTVVDVGDDVSREHAQVWREGGRWLIQDLESTNGTRVIRQEDKRIVEVGDAPIELTVGDTVCLGASTRFLVLPIMDPNAS